MLTPPRDICLILGLNVEDFKRAVRTEGSEVYVRYYRGKAKTLLSLREEEIDEAQAGSPTALLNVRGFIQQMEDDEADD